MIVDRFENPAAFRFLWALPVFALVFFYIAKIQSRALAQQISVKFIPLLTSSLSLGRRKFKMILEFAVLALCIFALARPQSGGAKQKVKSEGVEIMLLVDVSRSMMAEDVRPSRLELVKKELNRLIDNAGANKIGLVAFAGTAVTLSPLTQDKSALKMFIDSLSVDAVSAQGTDFKRALVEARGAFERGGVDPGDDAVVSRLVVIVSDGEDNEIGGLEMAKEVNDTGTRIYSMAVGTASGGTIPMRDERGNLIGNYRDKRGVEVVTKVNDGSLEELAKVGKGKFYHLTFGGDAVTSLLADWDRLKKAQFDDAEITNFHEDFQPFLILALLLALAELLLGDRRSKGRLWRGRFEVAKS